MWAKARVALVIETTSVHASSAISVPSDWARRFFEQSQWVAAATPIAKRPVPCRRRHQKTPLKRAGWGVFVRCPQKTQIEAVSELIDITGQDTMVQLE